MSNKILALANRQVSKLISYLVSKDVWVVCVITVENIL